MPRIQDTARIVQGHRRDLNPDGSETRLEQAWLIWAAARRQAEREGSYDDNAFNGRGGYVWRGTLASVIRSLWPEKGADQLRSFSGPLYTYLRKTGNARCVENCGDNRDDDDTEPRKQPVWEISSEWATVHGVDVIEWRQPHSGDPGDHDQPGKKPASGSKSPKPTIVPRPERKKPSPATEAAHRKRVAMLHAEHVDRVIEVLDLGEPLTAYEVAELTEFKTSPTTARNIMNEDPRVHGRTETQDEQRTRTGVVGRRLATLFSLDDPVPTRTMPGSKQSQPMGVVSDKVAAEWMLSLPRGERVLLDLTTTRNAPVSLVVLHKYAVKWAGAGLLHVERGDKKQTYVTVTDQDADALSHRFELRRPDRPAERPEQPERQPEQPTAERPRAPRPMPAMPTPPPAPVGPLPRGSIASRIEAEVQRRMRDQDEEIRRLTAERDDAIRRYQDLLAEVDRVLGG